MRRLPLGISCAVLLCLCPCCMGAPKDDGDAGRALPRHARGSEEELCAALEAQGFRCGRPDGAPQLPELPAPPPPPLKKASGTRPEAPQGKVVVELRTEPAGFSASVGEKTLGTTPLFVTIASEPSGPCRGGICSGGTCSGGSCSGGTCSGGSCMGGMAAGGMCSGAICMGGVCGGGTCEGAQCPEGYRCDGAQCTGGQCHNGMCTGQVCAGQSCPAPAPGMAMAGGSPTGGTCTGGTCSGGSCSGQTCSGGLCRPVTEIRLSRDGRPDQTVTLTGQEGPVVERRF